MAEYPSAIPNLPDPTAADKLSSVLVPHATQHKNVNDEIEAICTELGTLPKGAYDTVKQRIEAIEVAAYGSSGYSGWSGYSGERGPSGGDSGYSGYSGYSGISGMDGTATESGYSGYSGADGTSGYSGYSGISGYSGAGASGISGYSGYSGIDGSESGFFLEFDNADLSTGVLTVNHALGMKYNIVQVFDNNAVQVIPDDVTLTDANNLSVDLSSYGVISGTWVAVVTNGGGQSGANGASGISGFSGYSGAAAAGSGLGAKVDKSSDYGAQQAATDGFVLAYDGGGAGLGVNIAGYTDGNSNPTTKVAHQQLQTGLVNPDSYQYICFPVKKTDYWKVVFGGTTNAPAVYWISGMAGYSGYSGYSGTNGASGTSGYSGSVSAFGSWVDKSSSYGAQQASTDGYVTVIHEGSPGDSTVIGFTDANSDPTTERVRHVAHHASKGSITFPVKKNDYWKVTQASGTMTSVYWIPMGS